MVKLKPLVETNRNSLITQEGKRRGKTGKKKPFSVTSFPKVASRSAPGHVLLQCNNAEASQFNPPNKALSSIKLNQKLKM